MSRVKSLSKSGNVKKDSVVNSIPALSKDASSAASVPVTVEMEDDFEPQEVKVVDIGRRVVEKETFSNPTVDFNKQQSSYYSNLPFNGREESEVASGSMDKEKFEVNSYGGSTSQKMHPSHSQTNIDTEEKVQKVSPPRRKASRDTEKSDKLGNWHRKDSSGSDFSTTYARQQNTGSFNTNNVGPSQLEPEPPLDGNINALLEVGDPCGIVHYLLLFNHVRSFVYMLL